MFRHAAPCLAIALSALPASATEMFSDGYKPCGEQDTTVGIVDCVDAKTKDWDRRLNAAYSALQRSVDPAQRTPLLTAQRLWIQYRDANCAFYGTAEGTIRQIDGAECLRAMTQDRALELEQALKP